MVELFKQTSFFGHHQIALITLCGKGIKQSQSPREMDDSESNFKNIARVVQKQPFAFHSNSWISATTSDCRTIRTQMCRMYACSATTWSYSYPHTPTVCVTIGRTLICCGMYSRTLVRVRKTKLRVVGGMSTTRADWLLGLPLTIFYSMWLVLSNA
jgi:hypothetical protein